MLVDAIHKTTGKPVYIKEVATDSEELRIAQLLVQEEWVGDPRNHCVPVMKVFKDHENTNMSYMVMPFTVGIVGVSGPEYAWNII
jgi:hypothetical protein